MENIVFKCQLCKNYLPFRCGCTNPRCRVRSPEFIHKGLNCDKFKPRPGVENGQKG